MADEPSLRRTVTRTFWSRALVAALGAITSVVLARTLGPSGRGAYAVAVTYASTAMIVGHLSVEQAHLRFWADEDRRAAIVATAPLLGLGNGAVATIVALLVAPVVLPAVDGPVLIGLTAVIPLTVTLYAISVWVLRGGMKRVDLARTVAAFAQLMALSLLAGLGELTVTAVVVVWVGMAFLQAGLLLVRFGADRTHVSRRSLRDLEVTGSQYHLGSMATFLLWRIDVLVLAALSNDRQVGLYSLAVTIAELVYLVSDSIAQATLPMRLDGPLSSTVEVSARVVRLTAMASLIGSVVLAATMPILIPLVYGREFSGSTVPLLALIPGVVALSGSKPLGALLLRCHCPILVNAANGVCLAVNLGLNVALIPYFDAVGAAMASSVAYIVLAALSIVLAIRLAGLRPRTLIPRWAEGLALVRS